MHGTKICRRRVPNISYLLVSDNCFLFFKENEQKTHAMKDILTLYGEASGQEVNYKCEIFYFSRNV